MKNISITVRANDLLSIALFAVKGGDRPLMSGVNVDIKKGIISLVATDGICLGLLRVGKNNDYSDMNFTIPSETIVSMDRTNRQNTNHVHIEYDYSDNSVILSQNFKQIKTAVVKGEWVLWRGSMPKPFTPSFNYYDIALLPVFMKAKTLLGSKDTPIFYHNAEGIGVVRIEVPDEEVPDELVLPDGKYFIGIIQKFDPGNVNVDKIIPGELC